MSATMLSNSLIEIGWLATITIHVLIFILLGWTLAVRGLRIATDRRRQAMVTIWRPILAGSLIEAPVSLPAIHPRDRVLFLYLWNHLQESIKGESSEELCKIIRRTKMDEVVHHFLVSGTMRQQLLAIVTLGHLKEESAPSVVLVSSVPVPGAEHEIKKRTAGIIMLKINLTITTNIP